MGMFVNFRYLNVVIYKSLMKNYYVSLQKTPFINVFIFIKSFLVLAMMLIFDFFKLRGSSSKLSNDSFNARTLPEFYIQHVDEQSDVEDEINCKSSANNSRLSKVSAASDDDNNNESNVTPTLNNSIPRVTPELKIINSTPLNHYNHQYEGLSSRKYRRDLTKSW